MATNLPELAAEGMEMLARLSNGYTPATDAELTHLPLDLLLDLRRAVALMGDPGWRVLCAIDSRLVDLAGQKPGPSGPSGELGWARYRRLQEIANRLGVRGPMILLRNDALHQLLVQGEFITIPRADGSTVLLATIVTDRNDYLRALDFIAPLVALRQIAAYRLRNEKLHFAPPPPRSYSPTTQVRLKTNGNPDGAESKCKDCLALNHVRHALKVFTDTILPDCPSALWRQRLYTDFLTDLNETVNDLAKHKHTQEGKD
jgi:hypothetical protein